MTRFVVTGTNTDIGKTVFAAALTQALDGCYWKPVQAGLDDGTDAQRVATLTGLAPDRILPEVWRLKTPASPHHAADLERVRIDAEGLVRAVRDYNPSPACGGSVTSIAQRSSDDGGNLKDRRQDSLIDPGLAALDAGPLLPRAGEERTTARPLIIEGAGGALVPLNADVLFADVFARWGLPTIVCASTALGTINHSLLTLEALRSRGVPVLGIAFIGAANDSSEAAIVRFGHVKRLGRLPWLDTLTPDTLRAAFADGFDTADFA